MRGRILVVDDEPLKRISLQLELTELGFVVSEASDAQTARRILDSQPIDVVVTDVRMPGLNGLELLSHVKRLRPEIEVILMTAYATVDTAVLAIKRGAYDYITKPFTTAELVQKLTQVFATRRPSESATGLARFGPVIAQSRGMLRLIEQLRGLARTNRCVLLVGERGVGKELLGEALHAEGPQSTAPLVRFSPLGLSAAAAEQELYGQPRVPGVTRHRTGKIEQVEGGTLLLTDIDELHPELQARVARVLESREIDAPADRLAADARVAGDSRAGEGDAEHPRFVGRIVATARRDPQLLSQDGAFDPLLAEQLGVFTFVVPALRERPDDIPVLAAHFLEKHAALVGDARVSLSPHALDALMQHSWPGNVRELEHVLERALALCGGGEVRPEHLLPLAPERDDAAAPLPDLPELGTLGLSETLADIERRLIVLALRQCGGNQARAAHKLGIPRTTLRDKMARFNIVGT